MSTESGHASADKVKLTVLTSSGSKHELEISLNDSLSKLKKQVLERTSIPVEHQRIFSMGREVKTNGRSLETLGVGRFGILTIHVHNSKPPNTNDTSAHRSGRRGRTTSREQPIELEPTVSTTTTATGRRSRSQRQQRQEVVELLDDSDDEEDTKGEAFVVDMTDLAEESHSWGAPAGMKRRRVA